MRWVAPTITSSSAPEDVWGRARLRAILAAGTMAGLVFVTGLGLAMFYGLRSQGASGHDVASYAAPAAASDVNGVGDAETGLTHRDLVASRPMLWVAPEDARRGVPAAVAGPVIDVAMATGPGAAGVPTGFPRTPEGAVGQLSAIEVTVLQGMSILQTNAIYTQWALPGGVGAAKWGMTHNVQNFLGSAGQGQTRDMNVVVTASPVAAQVKGTDGPDWVLACVLLDVRATISSEARMGYGYCERMQWQPVGVDMPGAGPATGGGWMIAPGEPAAPAPSTWPGTELSFRAGWRTWVSRAPVPNHPLAAPVTDPARAG